MNEHTNWKKEYARRYFKNITLYIAAAAVAVAATAAMACSVSRIYRWTLRQYTSENVHVRVVINIALLQHSECDFSVFSVFHFINKINWIELNERKFIIVIIVILNYVFEEKKKSIYMIFWNKKKINILTVSNILTPKQTNKQANDLLKS